MAVERYVGQARTSVSAAGVVKSGPGRLVKIIVTTKGSAESLTVHDNASAASGTVLFAASGTAEQGTVYDLDVPAINGIYVTPGTDQVVLVVWS